MGVNEKTGNDRGIDKKYEKKISVAELKKSRVNQRRLLTPHQCKLLVLPKVTAESLNVNGL